jgi:hypothetical protein
VPGETPDTATGTVALPNPGRTVTANVYLEKTFNRGKVEASPKIVS